MCGGNALSASAGACETIAAIQTTLAENDSGHGFTRIHTDQRRAEFGKGAVCPRVTLAAADAPDDSAHFFGGGSGETRGAFFGRRSGFRAARFGRFCAGDAGGRGGHFDDVIVDAAALFVGIGGYDYPFLKDGATFDLATNFMIERRPDRFCHTT